jgi:protein-disulfide isomerase
MREKTVRAQTVSSAPEKKSDRSAKTSRPLVRDVSARGPRDAPITIIEFSDFECSLCANAAPVIKELFQAYPAQIRYVFKHSPLPVHLNAPFAHEAALAAGDQGKFWEMHDLIFANQRTMKRDDLILTAKQLGLKMDQFVADLEGQRFNTLIDADKEEGVHLGVNATPTFFINGQMLVGAKPLSEIKRMIEDTLLKGKWE